VKKVKFKGNPLNLIGIIPCDTAPDFVVVSSDMKEVRLSDYYGKIKVINSFPSLDTPVCDLQLKEFNKIATGLSEDVIVIGVSMDLPFAQKRFCEQNKIEKVSVVSDYKYISFGVNYCLLIKELQLLARSVIIIDKKDRIRYFQLVEELTNQPDYKETLEKLEEVIKSEDNKEEKCKKDTNGSTSFRKTFDIHSDDELTSLLQILSIIKREKGVDFAFEFANHKLIVNISEEKQLESELRDLFERVVY